MDFVFTFAKGGWDEPVVTPGLASCSPVIFACLFISVSSWVMSPLCKNLTLTRKTRLNLNEDPKCMLLCTRVHAYLDSFLLR